MRWATLCLINIFGCFWSILYCVPQIAGNHLKFLSEVLFFFSFWALVHYGGPLKWPLSVNLSVCLSVWHFSQEWVIKFFWFFAQWQIIRIFKNWQSNFLQENLFLPKFGQKEPKMVLKWAFWIFLKYFGISFSWYI